MLNLLKCATNKKRTLKRACFLFQKSPQSDYREVAFPARGMTRSHKQTNSQFQRNLPASCMNGNFIAMKMSPSVGDLLTAARAIPRQGLSLAPALTLLGS